MTTGQITKSRTKPRNILRGIVPTSDTFDDPQPTSLGNATDGNFSTETGAGTKVLGGAGTVGQYTFDLGSIKTVIVGARVSVSQNASATIRVLADSSDDNNTWRTMTNILYATTSVTLRIEEILPSILTGRYIRLRIYSTGACTASSKIQEAYAYELGI